MPDGPINHTFLMNSTIAMCLNGEDWPTPLYNMGYRIEWVEQSFRVGNLGKLKPDLISKIHTNNRILLMECKGGKSIRKEQLEKYLSVKASHVKPFVSVKSKDNIEVHFTYVVKSYPDFAEDLDFIFPEIADQIRDSRTKDDIDVL